MRRRQTIRMMTTALWLCGAGDALAQPLSTVQCKHDERWIWVVIDSHHHDHVTNGDAGSTVPTQRAWPCSRARADGEESDPFCWMFGPGKSQRLEVSCQDSSVCSGRLWGGDGGIEEFLCRWEPT
jgi:hypothetical protein